MLPHKTYRGENALHHLRPYEGIPPAFTKRKRVVVPSAMTVLCLRPGRKVRSIVFAFGLEGLN